MGETDNLDHALTATVDERGWTRCPGCDGSFKVDDSRSRLWQGRHGKCRQKLEFDGPGAHLAPAWEPPLRFEIPEPLRQVMKRCESVCVGACCGPGAFEIDAAWLIQEDDDPEVLARCIDQIDETVRLVRSHNGLSVTSDMVDFIEVSIPEVIEWFQEWRTILAAYAEESSPGRGEPV